MVINIVLALLPIISVLIFLLVLKKNAVQSSFAGVICTISLIFLIPNFGMEYDQILGALKGSAILGLSAIIVIIPGLYLNAIIRGKQNIQGISNWIDTLPGSKEEKALLLLLGFLPTVESLTGFGVSLFLGVPILMRLFSDKRGANLALLGMNIMPWGTLALATSIGASLIHVPAQNLSTLTSLTSFAVFPYLGLLALFVMGKGKMLRDNALKALILGSLLSSFLYIFSKYVSYETAGVFAGFSTTILGLLFLKWNHSSAENNLNKKFKLAEVLTLFLPYILVLSIIIFIRIIPGLKPWLEQAVILHSDKVKFSILLSPGLVLIFVSFLLQQRNSFHISIKEILWKSKNACLSISLFLILSQMMLKSGMVQVLAKFLITHASGYGLVMLSPLIGMISGFATGSNTGGNALLIGMQNEIGKALGQGSLFAAIHNSGCGHIVFVSLPIIVLVVTILKDETQELVGKNFQENHLLKFSLKASIGVYVAILFAASLLFYFNKSSLVI